MNKVYDSLLDDRAGHLVGALLFLALLLCGGLGGIGALRVCDDAGEQGKAEHQTHDLLHFVILLGELLVEINYEPILAALHEDSLKRLLKSLYLEQAPQGAFTDFCIFLSSIQSVQNVYLSENLR
jgi:hypothetical protein